MRSQEVVGVATTAVGTAFVALRIFTKIQVVGEKLGPSDYLTIAAIISTWIFAILIFPFDPWIDKLLVAEMKASGPNDLGVQQVYEGGFDLFNAVASIFFALALTLARLSILVFYLRLSPIRSFRTAVLSVIAFLCLETMISVVLSLLVFDPAAKPKVKVADRALGMFYGISNIVVDAAVLGLPMGVVMPLQMRKRRKAAVLCLFGIGAVVCAISTYRVTILTFISSQDTSMKSISEQLILSFAETNGAIVCGCVPVTTRFFTQFLPEVLSPYLFPYFHKSSSLSPSSSGGTYSTTIEKNRRRREHNKRWHRSHHNLAGFMRDSPALASEDQDYQHPTSREGIIDVRSRMSYEMMGRMDLESGSGGNGSMGKGTSHFMASDVNQSYDSLERNVLGKGRADTHICAQPEMFAPDQEMGITCTHDTRVSYEH